jgi:hypothetical protein
VIPVRRPRHTHTTRIQELEAVIGDLKQKMAMKDEEINRLLLIINGRKVVEDRLQRQLGQYEEEHRSMKLEA